MSKGETKNVADINDYAFADPTGQFTGAMENFQNMGQFGRQGMVNALDPNAAYNQFLGQSGGLINMAQGATAPLTQNLNAIAERQAQEGMQAAATQFNNQGAGRSGAAQRAMGMAAAQPFADVAAQQQQNQLGLASNLLGQSFGGAQDLQRTAAGLFGNVYNTGMSNYGNMASQMGGMMAPQYEYQPGTWDRMMQGAQFGANVGMSFLPFM